MKQEMMKYLLTNKQVNEIALFSAMSKCFNDHNNCDSTFVPISSSIVHGNSYQVSYESPSLPDGNRTVQRELADLFIIYNNIPSNKIRISFLQAKTLGNTRKIRSLRPLEKFVGDYFKWELLRLRPSNLTFTKECFPSNILSFTEYKSISSFGVFYKDCNQQWDMLYSIPELISPNSIPNSTKSSHRTMHPHHPYCPLMCDECQGNDVFPCCPHPHCCTYYHFPEAIYTHNIDRYEQLMLNGLIGAPINKYIAICLKSYFNMLDSKHKSNGTIKEVINTIDKIIYKNNKNNMNNKHEIPNDNYKIPDGNFINTLIINIENITDADRLYRND